MTADKRQVDVKTSITNSQRISSHKTLTLIILIVYKDLNMARVSLMKVARPYSVVTPLYTAPISALIFTCNYNDDSDGSAIYSICTMYLGIKSTSNASSNSH